MAPNPIGWFGNTVLQGNILIDDSGVPQLADFGLARILGDRSHEYIGTTTRSFNNERYLAYEVVLAGDDAIPTMPSDIYGSGCLGLEVSCSP